MYDENEKLCMFPSRIDIFKHFLFNGGYNNLRKSYDKLVQRIKLFINYKFLNYTNYLNKNNNKNDENDLKSLYKIFEYDKLIKSTKKICNNSNSYLLPYQTSLTIQIPGQLLPEHTDLPYFKYASRYSFPQWLLVVMKHSNLFNQHRIREVQAVIYIHPWNSSKSNKTMGGELLIYDNGPNEQPKILDISGGTAILCDGPNTIHATNIFMPNEQMFYNSTMMKKDTLQYLKYDKSNLFWRLYVNDSETDIIYDWNHIRASISSRLWCFDSKQEAINYDPYEINEKKFSMKYVLNILKNNLITKGVIDKKSIDTMNEYDLGLFLMDNWRIPKNE